MQGFLVLSEEGSSIKLWLRKSSQHTVMIFSFRDSTQLVDELWQADLSPAACRDMLSALKPIEPWPLSEEMESVIDDLTYQKPFIDTFQTSFHGFQRD